MNRCLVAEEIIHCLSDEMKTPPEIIITAIAHARIFQGR
jgi:hypothetical protein